MIISQCKKTGNVANDDLKLQLLPSTECVIFSLDNEFKLFFRNVGAAAKQLKYVWLINDALKFGI